MANDGDVIDAGNGARFLFDDRSEEMWIALETSGDTIAEVVHATESFICARSTAEIDMLIEALQKAKRFFDPALECDEAAEP